MIDSVILVCALTERLSVPIAGSIRAHCIDCGAEVWLSPASREAAGSEGRPCCLPCFTKRIETDPEPEVMTLTGQQMEELRKALMTEDQGDG